MSTTSSTVRDARQVPLSQVDKLRQDAESAAQVRALTTHPDVVALRVEKIRAQVDTLIWVGIALGLGFTMVNVQSFAAAGALAFTLPWLAAWVLDPMVSLVLIAVLRAEQVTARYQVPGMTGWVRVTKVFAFAATYVMNTWSSWVALGSTGSAAASGIVLHSVPPVLVYCAAEAGPILRDRLTEAVLRAARLAHPVPAPDTAQPDAPTTAPAPQAAPEFAPEFAPVAVDPMADTIELPVIHPQTPAPVRSTRTTTTRGTASRSGKPARATKRSKAAAKPPARSMEELRAELAAAIQAGEVGPEPSAEQIRKALRISPDRARSLRDELRDEDRPTPPAPPVGLPAHTPTTRTETSHTETSEVTRDAA